MPLGSATPLYGMPRPTRRKAKVTDPYTGQVIQQAGPYSPDEYGKLREASAAQVQGLGPGAGGMGSTGGTGMTRGMPVPRGGGSRGPSRWHDTWSTGGDGERVAFGLEGRARSGGGERGMPVPLSRGPVRSAVSVSTGQGAQGTGSGGGGFTASYAPRPQGKSYSDRDGSTTAAVSSAAGGGLNDFYADNPDAAPQVMKDGFNTMANALSSVLPWYAYGTGQGAGGMGHEKGMPVPLGQPFIAGDAQADGKPNEELIWATPSGVHVIPLKDLKGLPKLGEGTGGKTGRGGDTETRRPERTPRVDGRKVVTKGLPVPLSGLKQFYGNNPGTPTAASREVAKVFAHPGVPMKHPVEALGARGGEKGLPVPSAAVPVPKKAYGTTGRGLPVPKMAYGTLPDTVYQTGVPGQEDVLILKPTPYDAGGLNFSQGDGSAPVPHLAVGNLAAGNLAAAPDPLAVPQRGLPVPATRPASMSAFETVDEYNARREEMNPDGIQVGVTPRAPLVESRYVERGLPVPPQERAVARMEKDVMREARDNPMMAYRLLQDRAAAEQAQRAAEASLRRFLLTQQGLNERNQATIGAANERFNITQQAARDREAVATNFKLADESRKALGVAQSLQPPQFVEVPGSGGGVIMKGDKQGSGFIRPTEKGLPVPMEVMRGSGVYAPSVGGEPSDKFGTYEMTRPEEQVTVSDAVANRIPFYGQALKGLPVPGVTRPAQFKAVTKPTKPPAPKKVNRAALLDEIEKAEEIINDKNASEGMKKAAQRVLQLATSDLDGDGVPDVAQGGAGGGQNGGAGPAANPNAGYFK